MFKKNDIHMDSDEGRNSHEEPKLFYGPPITVSFKIFEYFAQFFFNIFIGPAAHTESNWLNS